MFGAVQYQGIKTAVNAVRKGQTIEFKNSLWVVNGKEHGVMGRGSALVKLELRNTTNGSKCVERFQPSDSVEVKQAHLEQYQYLYTAGDRVYLLNQETFEELELEKSALEGGEKLFPMLEDNMVVTVQFIESAGPVAFRLPPQHVYTVESCTDVVGHSKGATYKPATLTNGCRVTIPDFVKAGDRILVDTAEMKYINRA
ncbi:hypothetical protein K493DRAFT_5321 [Basidiobolus meristosporus CBS 931.73]|uniref:Elongation factor P n=1 Tax=Basidiobolus meristosporus CBS 931.73 TaxID=1314790 RepID=A0A1Y1ZA76_9FUNG|nr:hypothetical protein K493DRAFT_5321 [Basidiobolus meristosporus CBS 931.73]|eukprot:ORY07066.1 hypothetical protein K493DRAFT_5321 [Basidiobolus meristosporus CBS 931.73]